MLMEMLMRLCLLFMQGWAGIRKYGVFDQEASGARPSAEAHCHRGARVSERHHRILVRLI